MQIGRDLYRGLQIFLDVILGSITLHSTAAKYIVRSLKSLLLPLLKPSQIHPPSLPQRSENCFKAWTSSWPSCLNVRIIRNTKIHTVYMFVGSYKFCAGSHTIFITAKIHNYFPITQMLIEKQDVNVLTECPFSLDNPALI